MTGPRLNRLSSPAFFHYAEPDRAHGSKEFVGVGDGIGIGPHTKSPAAVVQSHDSAWTDDLPAIQPRGFTDDRSEPECSSLRSRSDSRLPSTLIYVFLSNGRKLRRFIQNRRSPLFHSDQAFRWSGSSDIRPEDVRRILHSRAQCLISCSKPCICLFSCSCPVRSRTLSRVYSGAARMVFCAV